MIFIRKITSLLFLSFLLSSCVGLKTAIIQRDIHKEIRESPALSTHLTGFCLYDPANKQYLARYQDELYFQPASNTKILTTLACLQDVDSIYSFYQDRSGDTVFLSPLGDPTFLHPDFPTQSALSSLEAAVIAVQFPNAKLSPFGPGWAWDDYPYYFQAERSWLPLYGNCVRIMNEDSLVILPKFFQDYTETYIGMKPGDLAYRERYFNLFRVWMNTDTSTFTREIPVITSTELALTLLEDTLHIPVVINKNHVFSGKYSIGRPLNPALSLMMQRSDNFLAEQLLINVAKQKGFASVDDYRKVKLEKWASFLPQSVIWVDGSGLSRYNMITPKSLVAILHELYTLKGLDYLKTVFPAGGQSGTIKNWYKSETGIPYVYAKTGSFSNNHNLSGYLITKSGRTLIFSLMNNNFILPQTDVKKEMERLLYQIYEAY